MSTETAESLREQVRQRYAEAARAADGGDGCGCGSGSCCEGEVAGDFGEALYSVEQRGELPDAAELASLGGGHPTARPQLPEGGEMPGLGSRRGICVIP